MKRLLSVVFISLLLASTWMSCKKKEIDCDGITPTYEADIKDLTTKACAYSGCHVAGYSDGDMSTFKTLKVYADNGTLMSEVVDSKNMPDKSGSGPDKLTDEEIRLYKCWIDNGSPEK